MNIEEKVTQDTETLKTLTVSKELPIEMPEAAFKGFLTEMIKPDPDPETARAWYESTKNQKVIVKNREGKTLFHVPSTGQTEFIAQVDVDYQGIIQEGELKNRWMAGAGDTYINNGFAQLAESLAPIQESKNIDAWRDILGHYGLLENSEMRTTDNQLDEGDVEFLDDE